MGFCIFTKFINTPLPPLSAVLVRSPSSLSRAANAASAAPARQRGRGAAGQRGQRGGVTGTYGRAGSLGAEVGIQVGQSTLYGKYRTPF